MSRMQRWAAAIREMSLGEPAKCLTIRQPWAWAIFHAGKPVENRSRRDGRMPPMCKHRGELWIHAGCTMTSKEYAAALNFMSARGLAGYWEIPARPELGAIIGRVRVVAHVIPEHNGTVVSDILRPLTTEQMRWWTGGYGLVLADPEPLGEPIPWRKGRLGIWTMPDELVEQVRRVA